MQSSHSSERTRIRIVVPRNNLKLETPISAVTGLLQQTGNDVDQFFIELQVQTLSLLWQQR